MNVTRTTRTRSAWRHRALALLVAALFASCHTAPGVPSKADASYRHDTEGISESELAHVWVSYQITVASIDGVTTDFEPPERCLYYRVSLPAGEHSFGLRLDYATATHTVRTDTAQDLALALGAGEAYRLIDLGAGAEAERVFQPYLQDGAPPSETIELQRPAAF